MTTKTTFCFSVEGWSWLKFNNLGLALAMVLKFYTSVAKGLKLKVRKFWELIPTFVEVTGEKLPPILNRVKSCFPNMFSKLVLTEAVTSTYNITIKCLVIVIYRTCVTSVHLDRNQIIRVELRSNNKNRHFCC